MTVFAETNLPTMIALGLLAAVVGMMLFRVQRYYRRHLSPGPPFDASSRAGHPSRTGTSPRTPPHGVAREMVEWEVQVHELVREMSGQLNSKMAALEHLIREADRAAARLEAALAAAGVASPAPAPPPEQPTHSPDDVRTSAGPQDDARRPTSQADALKPVTPADRVSEADRANEERSAARPTRQRRHEEIYTLADYGYDAAEIAQRVGALVGEIELILSLRERR
jgi:hypothetical protein